MFNYIQVDSAFWWKIAAIAAGFFAYVLLFRSNRLLAYLVLGSLMAFCAYYLVDWDYWNTYFRVPWDMGRYH